MKIQYIPFFVAMLTINSVNAQTYTIQFNLDDRIGVPIRGDVEYSFSSGNQFGHRYHGFQSGFYDSYKWSEQFFVQTPASKLELFNMKIEVSSLISNCRLTAGTNTLQDNEIVYIQLYRDKYGNMLCDWQHQQQLQKMH